MESLKELLSPPSPPVLNITISPPVRPQFYAHVHVESKRIVGISPALHQGADGETISIKIDYDLAERFLSGSENITRWIARYRNDSYSIVREEDHLREKLRRIDTLSIFEIVDSDVPYPDVKVELTPEDVLIHFNGETIVNWKNPVKLYFTGEGNPAYLKCAFTLDVNTLNEIQRVNELPEWPNPIRLSLADPEDTSVYTIKSNLKIAINRHEAASYDLGPLLHQL